ncbi:RICIN domain-containing protein [Streptomyces sp. NPDC049555]|uniref:RICIN domain-containing protein n=1 Tax=unclassified Streptomyces TaxID=2593676 RepID=UPI00343113A0
MSRITRVALAIGASVAALAGGVSAAHADEAPATAAGSPSVVQLQAAHSGKCLTIAGGSLRNGADAVQAKCADGLDNQLFELVPGPSATFELRAEHSGKCLEVENGSINSGAKAQQWWCVNAPHQRWRLVLADVTKDLYELHPDHADARCLDVKSSSKDDGAVIQQWNCNGTTAQQWRIQTVKG